MYDNETDAVVAIALASKAASTPWIVEYIKSAIYELGFGELKIAIKCDGAEGLQELRRAVANSRTAPIVLQCVRARPTAAW